ncbi:outer membrane protein OprM precursor [mine drainage metagenome]|uniref:Outer membrane protein OprM n=1 Tax=mine drainage metagenome TaxID=410659 RepID=A0A1J5S936_9ZZZZ
MNIPIKTLFKRLKINLSGLLLGSMVLLQSSLVFAADSIWYSTNDPLKTEAYSPPAIPEGYLADSACAVANVNNALTLADVVETALCNNPQTREAYANARVQAAQLGVAKSAYFPVVNDNVSANLNWANPESTVRKNPYNNLSNNIVASYLLYDFGNRDANLENARQLLQAASATQSTVVQSLLLNATQSYYQVQAAIAALSAAIESEHASEESYKAAQARYQAGVSTPADKLQAQTLLAQNTLSRITIEGTLKNAYGALANVMGLAANQAIKLTPIAITQLQQSQLAQNVDADINALIEQARVRRPDLMASEAQVKAAEASIAASRAAAKPTVSVAVSNSFQDGSNLTSTNNSALGITVSIPLFSGYGPTYKIRSAEAFAEAKSAQRDQLRLQISLDVWRAYQNLRTANESIRATAVLLSSAEESSRVALGRYKAGVGNILDTLTAQSALASARQQQIQASLNWNIARATLAQSIGGLDNAMIQTLPTGGNQPIGLN